MKLPPGQKLTDAHIAAPMRSAGVQMSGTNQWLVMRNLIAEHVYNDGYNIHGSSRDCLFENIHSAFEVRRRSASARTDDCQFRVNGLVSMGNSTGIADTGDSITEYDHVFIRDCLGIDLLFFGTNRHAIHHGAVLSSAHTVASILRGGAEGSPASAPSRSTMSSFAAQAAHRRGAHRQGTAVSSMPQHVVTMLASSSSPPLAEIPAARRRSSGWPNKKWALPAACGAIARAAALLKGIDSPLATIAVPSAIGKKQSAPRYCINSAEGADIADWSGCDEQKRRTDTR